MKINCSGPIDYIELDELDEQSDELKVCYKDERVAYIRRFRLVHFVNENRDHLGQEAISAIQHGFQYVWNKYNNSIQIPLNDEDGLQLFEQIC